MVLEAFNACSWIQDGKKFFQLFKIVMVAMETAMFVMKWIVLLGYLHIQDWVKWLEGNFSYFATVP